MNDVSPVGSKKGNVETWQEIRQAGLRSCSKYMYNIVIDMIPA